MFSANDGYLHSCSIIIMILIELISIRINSGWSISLLNMRRNKKFKQKASHRKRVIYLPGACMTPHRRFSRFCFGSGIVSKILKSPQLAHTNRRPDNNNNSFQFIFYTFSLSVHGWQNLFIRTQTRSRARARTHTINTHFDEASTMSERDTTLRLFSMLLLLVETYSLDE